MKPFNWNHPLIFSLPENNYSIVEAPVPVICGINLSKKYFNKKIKEKFELTSDTLTVFLDEKKNKLEFKSEFRNKISIPLFKNRIIQAKSLYNEYFNKYGIFSESKDLVWTQMDSHGKLIASLFKEIFVEKIVYALPVTEFYKDKDEKVRV